MSGFDDFTLVSTSSEHRLYDDFEKLCSAKLGDLQTSLRAALRHEYPEVRSLHATSFLEGSFSTEGTCSKSSSPKNEPPILAEY